MNPNVFAKWMKNKLEKLPNGAVLETKNCPFDFGIYNNSLYYMDYKIVDDINKIPPFNGGGFIGINPPQQIINEVDSTARHLGMNRRYILASKRAHFIGSLTLGLSLPTGRLMVSSFLPYLENKNFTQQDLDELVVASYINMPFPMANNPLAPKRL